MNKRGGRSKFDTNSLQRAVTPTRLPDPGKAQSKSPLLLMINSTKPFKDKSPRQLQVDQLLEAYEDHE